MTGEPFDSSTGSQAALRRWAFENDPQAATAPARAGFLARFERAVDPENRLEPAEREVRARRLMRAHMIALARRRKGRR